MLKFGDDSGLCDKGLTEKFGSIFIMPTTFGVSITLLGEVVFQHNYWVLCPVSLVGVSLGWVS